MSGKRDRDFEVGDCVYVWKASDGSLMPPDDLRWGVVLGVEKRPSERVRSAHVINVMWVRKSNDGSSFVEDEEGNPVFFFMLTSHL